MKTKTKLLLPLLFFAALLLVPVLTLYGLVKSPSGWSVGKPGTGRCAGGVLAEHAGRDAGAELRNILQ